VSISAERGQPSLRETAEARTRELKTEAAQHPLVRAVLEAFPGARIEAVRELVDEDTPRALPDSVDESSEGDEV
jgi:DNA polymerase-3 subunit gamma/tau